MLPLTGRRACADAGMGLVEVMVALGLFVLGSLSLLTVLTSSMSGTFDNRARITAASLAAADIDRARSAEYRTLAADDYWETVDGRRYRVVRTVEPTLSGGAPASCLTSGSSKQLHKKISTRVETAFRGRTRPVRTDTLVRAPVFDPENAAGAVSFLVLDRNGAPLAGLAVSISSGGSGTTNAQGCVFFDSVPVGTHTVEVNSPGRVTLAHSTSLTKAVSVVKGQITPAMLQIGTAAEVRLSGNVFNGATTVDGFAWPSDLVLRMGANDQTLPRSTSSTVPVFTRASIFTSSGLHPRPSGYEAYLGPCSRAFSVASDPGTNPVVHIPLSPVTVILTIEGSQSFKARDRPVIATSLTRPDCAETVRWPAWAITDGTCTHQCPVKLAVPPGRWRFTPMDDLQRPMGSTDQTIGVRTASTVYVPVA